MPSLTAVGIIVLALLIAAALFLMYEIGKLVGERRATDKFPEAKKAAVHRSRSVLSAMFAEQLAPYLPDFPFSPTEAKFIGAPIDFLIFKGMDSQHIEEVIFVEEKSGAARSTTMSTASKTRLKISVSAGTCTASPLPSRTPPTPLSNPRSDAHKIASATPRRSPYLKQARIVPSTGIYLADW
jgi:hypothetical protein